MPQANGLFPCFHEMSPLVATLQHLRLPSLRKLVAPQHPRLFTFRCRAQQDAKDSFPDDDSQGSSLGKGAFAKGERPKQPGPQKLPDVQKPATTTDALINTLAGVSLGQGRVSKATSMVMGSDTSEEKWRQLDEQVNEYPRTVYLKAIGSGGEDFRDAMVKCAESVVGALHEECVSTRASGKGNYISVTISAWVETQDQVLAIYANMKEDPRLKFFF